MTTTATAAILDDTGADPPDLTNYWHPVLESAEVTADAPIGFELLGRRLVAYRDSKQARVLEDLCIHRGTALSLGSTTPEGCIACPYHGWEYNGDGRCVNIPALEPGSPIPSGAKVKSFATTERYGLVWVALTDPVAPITEWPTGEWEDPGVKIWYSHRYSWQASAARTVENFMDISHFPFLHDGLLGSRDRTVRGGYDVVQTDYGFYFDYKELEPGGVHSPAGTEVHWEYFLWLPFSVHLRKGTPDGQSTVVSLVCRPTTDDTNELFLFLSRNYNIDEDDQGFLDFTHVIMEADRRVVESQRPVPLPVRLTEELHLRGPDAAALAYRRALGPIGGI